ncbi:MAG: class I SAM-dependent methyltransferase [Bacteroidetes bacterium]|nr:class I SAM-dependent methyltransferase [Bacteroidota bacterium]
MRWDSELDWQKSEVKDKLVIEFGSGAGRFVDIVSRRGAKWAVGVDITGAVDAAMDNLGDRPNVIFVQADFFKLPFREGTFDNAYSIGVLHHTPDPETAFHNMTKIVNEEGLVGLSVYEISLYPRPNRNTLKVVTKDLLWTLNLWRCEFFRFFTSRMPEGLFLAYCKYFVPILHYINKVPILRYIRYLFPSTCYRTLPVEWSMLDTHDSYATKIVHQYRHKDIFQWFLKAKLFNIVVHNGRAGWVSLTGSKKEKPYQHERYVVASPGIPGT